MKKSLVVLMGILLSLSSFSQNWKAFSPGGWGIYKMETSKVSESMANSNPGLDPKMLEMLPPDQRAKIEAQMKQSQQVQGAAGDASQDIVKDMDLKMTFSVPGEETRNGKVCSWLEVDCNGNMPNIDKMWEANKAQMKKMNVSDADIKKNEAKINEAKKKMEGMPQRTKDGKFKSCVKMLMEKPNLNSTSAGSSGTILEMWQKEGDNASKKLTDEELKKKNEANMTTEELNKKKVQEGKFMEDVIKIPGVTETSGMAGMAAASGIMSDAQGSMQQSVGDIQQAGEAQSLGYGIEMMQIVSKETKPVGVEMIDVVSVGKVKTLHLKIKRTTLCKMRPNKNSDWKNMQEWSEDQDMWVAPDVYGLGMAKCDILSTQKVLRLSMDDAQEAAIPASTKPKPYTAKTTMAPEKLGPSGVKSEF